MPRTLTLKNQSGIEITCSQIKLVTLDLVTKLNLTVHDAQSWQTGLAVKKREQYVCVCVCQQSLIF